MVESWKRFGALPVTPMDVFYLPSVLAILIACCTSWVDAIVCHRRRIVKLFGMTSVLIEVCG